MRLGKEPPPTAAPFPTQVDNPTRAVAPTTIPGLTLHINVNPAFTARAPVIDVLSP